MKKLLKMVLIMKAKFIGSKLQIRMPHTKVCFTNIIIKLIH